SAARPDHLEPVDFGRVEHRERDFSHGVFGGDDRPDLFNRRLTNSSQVEAHDLRLSRLFEEVAGDPKPGREEVLHDSPIINIAPRHLGGSRRRLISESLLGADRNDSTDLARVDALAGLQKWRIKKSAVARTNLHSALLRGFENGEGFGLARSH